MYMLHGEAYLHKPIHHLIFLEIDATALLQITARSYQQHSP